MKLDELARTVGVAPRTVRYYVQRGLLPAPHFRGRDTEYGEEHEVRLRAIRRLQELYLPLDAIQIELERHSLDELRQIAQGKRAPKTKVAPPPAMPPAGTATAAPPAGTWTRWQLAPGLELHLSANASDDVKELAAEVRRLKDQKERNEG